MGSFIGHILPGTLFFFVGVWHMWSAVVRYVLSPESFRVRVWNPVEGLGGQLKHLELYVVTVGSFIDLCIELLYSTHLKFLVKGTLNPVHMNNFEHSGMLLMFFIFGVIALLNAKTRYLPLPDGALCIVASTAFCAEYLLFAFHSTTHRGLEGYYHLLLVILIGLCIFSTVLGALFPTSFSVDLGCGIFITLQGLWFYLTAFTLYGPLMPHGCQNNANVISCHSSDSEVRGELLADFQFFSSVVGVLISVVGSFCYATSKYGGGISLSELKSMHLVDNGLVAY